LQNNASPAVEKLVNHGLIPRIYCTSISIFEGYRRRHRLFPAAFPRIELLPDAGKASPAQISSYVSTSSSVEAALRSVVLPRIVQAKSKTSNRHLRIWSAGCSTGEEAYTLSMVLREELEGQLQGWTFEILATDLNQRSIVHAEQGLYGEYSTRHLSEHFRRKYFVSSGKNLQINADIKTS
jgi:CheR methyltransferase, SAM binding domain